MLEEKIEFKTEPKLELIEQPNYYEELERIIIEKLQENNGELPVGMILFVTYS